LGDYDSEEARKVKTLIRETEGEAACMCLGIKKDNVFSLRLPFYETGHIQKKPLSEEDVQIVVNVINRVQPDCIYAAGDLTGECCFFFYLFLLII
jgi:glucosamine-6-phosphate deaminase